MVAENCTNSQIILDIHVTVGLNSSNVTNYSKLGGNTTFSSYDIDLEYWRQFLISIYLPLLLIGVLGNFTTVIAISYTKLFRRVTFTAIALLAGTDLAAVIARYTLMHLQRYNSLDRAAIFHWIFMSSVTVSNMHVVILLRLRYLLIVQPVKSLSITPARVLKQSGLAWIFSLICGALISINVCVEANKYNLIVSFSIGSGFTFLSVFIPALFYHYKKVKTLKEKPNLRGSFLKMNAVMVAILAIQITARLLIPFSLVLLIYYGDTYHIYLFYIISNAIDMVNHAVNPVIYFFSIVYGLLFNNCQRNFLVTGPV